MAGHGSGDDSDPNLVPLLDLVFQLIMFFMITVNMVGTDHFHPDVVLPVAQAAVPMDQTADKFIFLNMNKEGKLVGFLEDLNTQEKLKAHLMREKDALERVARAEGKVNDLKITVVLRAHKDARYRDVWEVLQSCANAGFRRWQMRVMTGGPTSA